MTLLRNTFGNVIPWLYFLWKKYNRFAFFTSRGEEKLDFVVTSQQTPPIKVSLAAVCNVFFYLVQHMFFTC